MYDIYLLRHGRSRADDEDKCEGRYDSPLTETGQQQAESTAQKFKESGYEFDKIICSPLKRAYETAEIINKEYKIDIIKDPLWMEMDNGIIAGMQLEELKLKYPLPDFFSPYRYFPEKSGETRIQLHARASLAINSLIDRGPGKYLVVSHGAILNAVLRSITGSPVPVNNSGLYFRFNDNSYMHLIYYEANHSWVILKFG